MTFSLDRRLYAMATGDCGPLRLMLRLIQQAGLDEPVFVHALQNQRYRLRKPATSAGCGIFRT